jgi:hypothetical protein
VLHFILRDRRRASGAAALSAACLAGSIGTAAAATTVEGVFAQIGGQQQVAGELVATPAGEPNDLKLDISFHRVAEKNALKRYEIELNRQMHVFAISDDLGVFLHHHVAHVIDGHGQVRMSFPAPGLYHIFVDAAPKTIGQQVLRFDLMVGEADPLPARPLGSPETTVKYGLYTIAFDQLELKAGEAGSLTLHIAEHGKPAQDLHDYLGVAAQAILVGTESMDYVHLHTMPLADMGPPETPAPPDQEMPEGSAEMPVPADLVLPVPPLPAGSYKLWVQFLGGRTLYTVPFVAIVK